MEYPIFEIIWYILIYSFLGWCLEIIYGAFTKRKLMNKGLLNSPFCPLYGFVMVFILIFFHGLKNRLFFLFLACTVIVGIMELVAGVIMEKIFKRKWWDYSEYKYNLGGYVSFPFTLLWGIIATGTIRYIHPLFSKLVHWIPTFIGNSILVVVAILLLCDMVITIGAIFKVKSQSKSAKNLAIHMTKFSTGLGNILTTLVLKRVVKAYPNLQDEETGLIIAKKKEKSTIFAYGCSFHKIVWLFFIGAFLGDLVETVFCRITAGEWMSRSSVIYGPFSIVWGLGIAGLTFVLHWYKDKGDRYIFILGTIMGGVYEYVCSVFTEMVFGTVFWDYSKIPFNIGGRVNLLYCFFWGIAAVVWIKIIYPFLSGGIEKVPIKVGKVISYMIIVFMIFNMSISALALVRYSERNNGNEADLKIEKFLDRHYSDERMERIYPNAISKK